MARRFAHEEKRDLVSTFEYIHPDALGVRYTNSDPEGRYTLVKEIICDPHHSVVLQRVRLEADEESAFAAEGFCVVGSAGWWTRRGEYGASDRHCGAQDAAGFTRRKRAGDGGKLRLHSRELRLCGSERWLSGHLKDNFQMDWEFGSATNGNIALFGEVQLRIVLRSQGQSLYGSHRNWRIKSYCARKNVERIDASYEEHRERFISQWERVKNPDWLAAKSRDGGRLMRTSHEVLLAHEDKTYSGVFIASASIPWGQVHGDEDLGGYHLVWTRDMVQTATALLASNVRRRRDGRWSIWLVRKNPMVDLRRIRIDRLPYWNGVQLDEVAFPIILAWRLWKENALGEMDIFPFVERAAGFLVRTCADYKSGALGGECGLFALDAGSGDWWSHLRGGDLSVAKKMRSLRIFSNEFADWIESHIEDWTVTNDGVLLPEVKRHYMRIRPPEQGDAYVGEGSGN